jgi:hypothetical protein
MPCYDSAMPLRDTDPKIEAMQRQIERAMTGEQRIQEALEMSVFAREFAKAKVRTDHPEWSEAQVAREVLRLEFLPEPMPAGFR